jgi:biopolymer transport protein ExbD
MKRHRRDYEMIADMNLTNLLDTAFVLLITFIIAAPTMRSGLRVDLPEVAIQETMTSPPQSRPVTITIQKEKDDPTLPERVIVDDRRLSMGKGPDSLDETIAAKVRMYPNQKLDVIIEMDKEARYNVLAQVLAVLREHNITNVGLPLIPLEAAVSPPPRKNP